MTQVAVSALDGEETDPTGEPDGREPDGGDPDAVGPDGGVPDGGVPDDTDGSAPDSLAERLLRTLLDNSTEIITVFNPDGSWRYSNAAATRLLGLIPDFDPVTGVLELLHTDDAPMAPEILRRIRANELPPGETFELRIRGRDGEWRYLESTGENLVDDPVVQGFVIRSEDVTERREAAVRLREANERLITLIGSLYIAALVEDTDRVIVLTNEAFVDLFELRGPPGALVGRTLAELGPELSRRFGDPTRVPGPDRVTRILRDRRRVIGDRIAMLDGRVLERDYVPIFVDHGYRGHLWLFRDISAQARNEAEWTQLLAMQRQENDRLVELDRVKASFLAEISHELRTPLTSILSFTDLLRDGVGRDEPAEQVEFLDVITRNADRLLRLVDDLVLLDRAETGILPVEWGTFDVAAVVHTAVTTFAHRAESQQISLESHLGEGPLVFGDAQRIAQLLDVLLSNAIKFTPEGGWVKVTAAASEDHWFITVADTGIGVPLDEREALFERFYRASNARAARIPGSGLGLSVARAIARLHRGEISFGNGEAGGSVVLFTLPFGSLPDLEAAAAADPDSGLDMEAGPGPELDYYSDDEFLLDSDFDAEPAPEDADGVPEPDEPEARDAGGDPEAGVALERDLPSDQEPESGPADDE
ncbi:MAG: ATP-binding protein [Acidimicrobiales bacterium]